MSWRTIQLGDTLCDQDRVILDLFDNRSVRYVGQDFEFSKHLQCKDDAEDLVLIINQLVWMSDVFMLCHTHLTNQTKNFYIGINRYLVLGNDTNVAGIDILDCIQEYVKSKLNFEIIRSGGITKDLGRCFNFVQPLTWIYGNQSHRR
jgi:hypothetical protein